MKLTYNREQLEAYVVNFASIMVPFLMSMIVIFDPFENFVPIVALVVCMKIVKDEYQLFYKRDYRKTFHVFYFIPSVAAAIRVAYEISSHGFSNILPPAFSKTCEQMSFA